MEVITKVNHWGNSSAIRLHQSICRYLQVKDGDQVKLSVNDLGQVVLAKVSDKPDDFQSALMKSAKENRRVLDILKDI